MTIEEFEGDFSVLRDLYSDQPDRLADQEGAPDQTPRFLQIEGGRAVAELRLIERPDGKVFVSFKGAEPDRGALIRAADQSNPGVLNANVDDVDWEAYEDLGFDTVVVSEAFSVSFDPCLAKLERARKPEWCEFIKALDADVHRLSELDNRLRRDIAGTEDWDASVDWMKSEVAAPEIHRHEYLVAVVKETDEYIGLIRVWRNSGGPRLGMVAVTQQFRGSLVGPSLILEALTTVSKCGFSEFETETQLSNRRLHRRLRQLAVSKGQFAQMRREL